MNLREEYEESLKRRFSFLRGQLQLEYDSRITGVKGVNGVWQLKQKEFDEAR